MRRAAARLDWERINHWWRSRLGFQDDGCYVALSRKVKRFTFVTKIKVSTLFCCILLSSHWNYFLLRCCFPVKGVSWGGRGIWLIASRHIQLIGASVLDPRWTLEGLYIYLACALGSHRRSWSRVSSAEDVLVEILNTSNVWEFLSETRFDKHHMKLKISVGVTDVCSSARQILLPENWFQVVKLHHAASEARCVSCTSLLVVGDGGLFISTARVHGRVAPLQPEERRT